MKDLNLIRLLTLGELALLRKESAGMEYAHIIDAEIYSQVGITKGYRRELTRKNGMKSTKGQKYYAKKY